MSVTVTRDGIVRPQPQDIRVETAMLPSTCPQNHAANLLPLPDGSLMCVWFGGTQEGSRISLCGARVLPEGASSGARRSNCLKTRPALSKTRCCSWPR